MRYVDSILGIGPKLDDWLRERLAGATSAAIRTGFLSAPAVDEMTEALSLFLARGGRMLFVAGGAIDQADPDAVSRLAGMLHPYPNAAFRIVVDPEEFQNAKTYHLGFADGHAEALVGSANFTRGGMESNHEAGVLFDDRETGEDAVVSDVLRGIEAFRDRAGSTPVTEGTALLLASRQGLPSRRTRGRGHTLRLTQRLKDVLRPAVNQIDAAASSPDPVAGGLSTGFEDLDDVIGGLAKGSLTVIGSRPAVGRTTLLLDFVRHAAVQDGLLAALFCLDRPQEDVVQQVMCAEARIRRSDIRDGRMSDDEWTRLAQRLTAIADSPLLLNNTPAPDLEALCAHATELADEQQLQLVAIDPLSMIDAGLDRSASREREISHIVRRLKVLALELSVPVVVTAELGRTLENRTDRRPILGDLRDSDTLSQVADIVLLLHRPDVYERDDPRAGEADVIVAKHRNGRTTTVTLAHQLHYGRFAALART